MERVKHYQSEERRGVAQEGEWIDQDLAVKADTPLVNSPTNKKVIIRLFDFAWKKGMTAQDKMIAKASKQVIFNSHAMMIRDFLWKDGLRILENEDPKLQLKKKGYRIAVACEARPGTFLLEEAHTLQDMLKVKKK